MATAPSTSSTTSSAASTSEVKNTPRENELHKRAGTSLFGAVGLSTDELDALATIIEAENKEAKYTPEQARAFEAKLASVAKKNPQLKSAMTKLLTADVGGGIITPSQQVVEEVEEYVETKKEFDPNNPYGSQSNSVPQVQTRRIQGPQKPATPKLAMVDNDIITKRLKTSIYQWAPQEDFLICPRLRPNYVDGQPDGVPKPENVSAISLFGIRGLYYAYRYPVKPDRKLNYFKSLEEVPQYSGIGRQADWASDDWFVRQRFAGPNAGQIAIVKSLPPSWLPGLQQTAQLLGWSADQVTAEQKKLQGLIDTEQLFAVDYSNVFNKADGTPLLRVNPINNTYLAAPIALFQYDTVAHTFIPYAIQVESDTVKFPNQNMIYFRDIANGWAWRYAKMALQSADWNYHEIGSHLAKTHLVVEIIGVASHRNFGEQHPLYQLLVPHFTSTMALNYLARSTLVPDVISQLSPLGFEGACDFAQYLTEKVWDIRQAGCVDDLIARGFKPETLNTDLPTYYASRDSLALWKILQTFVTTVVSQSYDADQSNGTNPSITADIELQAWVKELNSQLTLGFPMVNNSKDLIKVLTTIIYTASVKHSAVNYLQDYYWSYMPNAPPFLRQSPPTVAQILDIAPGDRNTYYSNYLIGSLTDKAAEAGQDAIVWTLSQEASNDETLQGYATSKSARRNNLTAWMNPARDTLQSQLKSYDDAISAENRPAPGYNILRSFKAAISICI